jgi:hypothetical protein
MIPETGDEASVRLYRATAFPSTWELDTVLYEREARDTSAVEHDGRWWFFTTFTEPRGGASMLMLFMADSLRGAWVPHPANPISLDVRNVRGAGAIIRDGGRLIRPSQDCSQSYGYAFTLYEITELTPESYRERGLLRVGPEGLPRLDATHTYSASDHFEVIDGRFQVPLIRPGRNRGSPVG